MSWLFNDDDQGQKQPNFGEMPDPGTDGLGFLGFFLGIIVFAMLAGCWVL
jgi:hypothetical protein